MIALSTRSLCDECGRPAVVIDGDIFLCERCDVEIHGAVENSDSISSAILSDGYAAASGLAPAEVAAPNSVSPSPSVGRETEPLETSASASGESESRQRDRQAAATRSFASNTLGLVAAVTNSNPVAKATEGKAGTAGITDLVRRSTTGTGLRVGEAGAVRPATSEIMDATAGETAPNSEPGAGSQPVKSSVSNQRANVSIGVTAGETAHIFSLLSLPETGVNPVPRGGLRVTCAKMPAEGRTPFCRGHHGFESHTAAISNSSGALGNLKPGSKTWGEPARNPCRLPAPSGRADESAISPAVAGIPTTNPAPSCVFPPEVSVNCGAIKSSQVAPLLSSDFESEVRALEADWRSRGIIMNATQFCVSVLSDNNSKSSVSVGA